jgi:hypothetical protein
MPLDTTNRPETEITDEATALLIRARGFVERGWCRGVPARNFLEWPVTPGSKWATRWCAGSALLAARMTASDLAWRRARIRLVAAIGGEHLPEFNDRQETVEPVLAAFDKAIGLIEFVSEGEAFDRAIAAGNSVAPGDH